MANISMIGTGSAAETGERLIKAMDGYALVSSTQRRVGGADIATLVLEEASFFLSGGCTVLIMTICGNGEQVIVDITGYSWGRSLAYLSGGEEIPVIRVLKDWGFEEYQRESWKTEDRPEPVEMPLLEEIMHPRQSGGPSSEPLGTERLEKPKRGQRKRKRSYDPEL